MTTEFIQNLLEYVRGGIGEIDDGKLNELYLIIKFQPLRFKLNTKVNLIFINRMIYETKINQNIDGFVEYWQGFYQKTLLDE